MQANNLISAYPHPRKQAARRYEQFSAGRMRLSVAVFLIVIHLFITVCPPLSAQEKNDSLQAEVPVASYILKDIGSSKVLMAKDIDRPVSPASLTKIMTCLLAIESGRLNQDVLITKASTSVEPSKAGFKPGEKIKLIDLVKAAMVNSSNDAAFAIAIHLSGSVESFVSAMNNRARTIGMRNTRFTNPAGFDKGIYAGNYSTAGDLMRLTEHAIRNSVFNSIARLEQAVFLEQTTHKIYYLKTHNKLLEKYPYAVGIKTGYTNRAGRCLIGRAVKDNRDLLLVMLNAKTDRWTVASDMFDRAFLARRPDPSWLVETYRDDFSRTGTSREVLPAREDDRQNAVTLPDSGSKEQLSSKSVTALKTSSDASSKIALKSKKGKKVTSKTALKSKKGKKATSKTALKSKKGKKVTSKTALKSKKGKKVTSKTALKSKKGRKVTSKTALKSKKGKKVTSKTALKSKKGTKVTSKTVLKSKKGTKVTSKTVLKSKKGTKVSSKTAKKKKTELTKASKAKAKKGLIVSSKSSANK
jgi:D-alanyl-D-alanine carboxypeptidase (penicillin-binding protein 5/6)